MDTETRFYDKSDSSGYEVSRNRAQKIDFKRIAEILQRNIKEVPR